MPIPIQNFNFNPAIPALQGLFGAQKAIEGGQQQYANQLAARHQSLANQASQMQNQYLQPMLAQKLAQAHATTGLTQARIPQTQAATALTREQTTMLPLNLQEKLDVLRSQHNPLASLKQIGQAMRGFSPDYKESIIRDHLPAMNDMVRRAYNYAMAQPSAQGQTQQPTVQGVLGSQPQAQPQAQSNLSQTLGQPSPLAGATSQALGFAGLPQLPQAPQSMGAQPQQPVQPQGVAPQQPSFNTTAAQLSAQTQLMDRKANASEVSPALTDRFGQTKVFDGFLHSKVSVDALQTLAKYSGIINQGKAFLQNKLGDAGYAKLEAAKQQYLTIMAGGINYLEKLPRTTEGLATGKNYFKQVQSYWNTDPKRSLMFLQKGLDYLHAETGAVYTAAQPSYMVDKPGPRIVLAGMGDSTPNARVPAPPASVTNGKQFAAWMNTMKGNPVEMHAYLNAHPKSGGPNALPAY